MKCYCCNKERETNTLHIAPNFEMQCCNECLPLVKTALERAQKDAMLKVMMQRRYANAY